MFAGTSLETTSALVDANYDNIIWKIGPDCSSWTVLAE